MTTQTPRREQAERIYDDTTDALEYMLKRWIGRIRDLDKPYDPNSVDPQKRPDPVSELSELRFMELLNKVRNAETDPDTAIDKIVVQWETATGEKPKKGKLRALPDRGGK